MRPLSTTWISLTLILAGIIGLSTACNRRDNPPPPGSAQASKRPPRTVAPEIQFSTPPEFASTIAAEDSSKPSALPLMELTMEPKALAALEHSVFSNQTVPGFFRSGTVNCPVRIRYRGAWARSWPKKPLKIFFDGTNRFEGARTLNLNSGWHDPALIRECLAYHVYRACGAPAPKSRAVRVNVNGRFRGVYIQVEQPDKAFVASLNLKGATVYKAASRFNQADERDLGPEMAYRQHYEKQTRKREGYSDLQEFCRELARTKHAGAFFKQRVEVEKYINYLAASALVQNWDGYNKNHYLIHDRQGSGKWLVVPWDLDRTFGDHWNWGFDEAHLSAMLGTASSPGVTGWNRLQERFLSDPTLRARFLKRLQELLETEFTPQKLFPVLGELEAQVAPDAALDQRRWRTRGPGLHKAISQVKRFIEQRRAFLLREVAALREGL